MKHLSRLLALFFWGVVLHCLKQMVAAYPGFTINLLAVVTYLLWFAAVMLILHDMWDGWRHCREPAPDAEVPHEH